MGLIQVSFLFPLLGTIFIQSAQKIVGVCTQFLIVGAKTWCKRKGRLSSRLWRFDYVHLVEESLHCFEYGGQYGVILSTLTGICLLRNGMKLTLGLLPFASSFRLKLKMKP